VFRWVGVAAPTQRCFRGISQWVTAGLPGSRPLCLRCPAVGPALVQSGGGRSECSEMAAPPVSIAGSRNAQVASDLESVTLGSPLDPFVGGSLEDACCGYFHVASVTSPWQVPKSCAIGMYHWYNTFRWVLWCGTTDPRIPEAKGSDSSDGSAQPHGSPSGARCSAPQASPGSRAHCRAGCRAFAVLTVEGLPHGDGAARSDRERRAGPVRSL
jgi:hypothetical protein